MDQIEALRHASRKLVRELGIIQLDKSLAGPTALACHALVEIGFKPGITVSEIAELLVVSVSAASRLIQQLHKAGFVKLDEGKDKRSKTLFLTKEGQSEVENIDEFSHKKIEGAFEHLSSQEQELILHAIQKYSDALEKSRRLASDIKIRTISTSRPLRRQIVAFLEDIQKNEFNIPITDEINAGIMRAEEEYYYNNSYNFWYATDDEGEIIGSIGLKKIDPKNGEIKKLFVAKPYRGKGVAQKLLNHAQKAAAKHGFSTLFLGTVDVLTSAHAFYKKCGFTQISEKELPKGFERCSLDTLFFRGSVI